MQKRFVNTHIAVCGTGYRRYVEEFYRETESTSPAVVNMQIRYWVEAVEKFYSLDPDDYDEKILEEGILVVNNMANSLLFLGGVNWTGKGQVPPLLRLFDGDSFELKRHEPSLYQSLEQINRIYNKVSKHFSLDRKSLFEELTYSKLKSMLKAASEIWYWVCKQDDRWSEFMVLFHEPIAILSRTYFPED